jgi:septum formation protein
MYKDKFILASSSVSRLTLLKNIEIVPTLVVSPEIDESRQKNEFPKALVKRLAREKMQAAVKILAEKNLNLNEYITISADTIVHIGSKVLDKTEDEKAIINYLKLLSNKTHYVTTSFCIFKNAQIIQHTITTKVKFRKLTEEEICYYASLEEAKNKAGGYSIIGFASCFIEKIVGSYTNVIGLPICQLTKILNN